MGVDAELQSAQRRLDDAYEQARPGGYQPGCDEMRELAAAEQSYQRARSRDNSARAAQEPDLGAMNLDRIGTTSVAHLQGAEIEIDLRDAGPSWPGRVARSPSECAGPPRRPGR